jgi:hypothetical protein
MMGRTAAAGGGTVDFPTREVGQQAGLTEWRKGQPPDCTSHHAPKVHLALKGTVQCHPSARYLGEHIISLSNNKQ